MIGFRARDRRGYTYTVEVYESGRIKRITAGCRVWFNFDQAFQHYIGFARNGVRMPYNHWAIVDYSRGASNNYLWGRASALWALYTLWKKVENYRKRRVRTRR